MKYVKIKKGNISFSIFGHTPNIWIISNSMKNVVFRHTDKYVLEHLLKEIGRHRLNMECENMKLPFPKRLGLFYLESNDHCTFLKYKYQKGDQAVMKLDRFALPESGWVRVKLQ